MSIKIDEVEFLAGVERLQVEEGDWREHLPYEASRDYRVNSSVFRQYEAHVSKCSYCQELVELFSRDP